MVECPYRRVEGCHYPWVAANKHSRKLSFRYTQFWETQESRRHREEGPGFFTLIESQIRSPGPFPTSYPPPKELRLQFYTFGIRGRTLSIGKAEERKGLLLCQ